MSLRSKGLYDNDSGNGLGDGVAHTFRGGPGYPMVQLEGSGYRTPNSSQFCYPEARVENKVVGESAAQLSDTDDGLNEELLARERKYRKYHCWALLLALIIFVAWIVMVVLLGNRYPREMHAFYSESQAIAIQVGTCPMCLCFDPHPFVSASPLRPRDTLSATRMGDGIYRWLG